MSLTNSYKSEKTNVVIKSIGEVDKTNINPDLIELADSGLINKNILNFGIDSFVFESDNVLMPNMIYKNLIKYNNIIGLSIDKKLLTFDSRKKIYTYFYDKISTANSISDIYGYLNIEKVVIDLRAKGKDSVADLLHGFFSQPVSSSFKFNINLYESDSQDELFIKFELEPNLTVESLFEDYIQAILYENRLFKTNVGSEKMAFCPLETRLGAQVQWLTSIVLRKIELLNTLLINNLIEAFEKELDISVDEYLLETNKLSGVELDNNVIYYFQNVVSPVGTVAILTDSFSDERISLAYLKEQVKFIPYVLNVGDSVYKDMFINVYELKKLCSLI